MCTGMRIEDDGNEDNHIAEENRQDGLPPIHASADERRCEHVSGDAGCHGDPECGKIPDTPFAPLGWYGREVGAVEGAVLHLRNQCAIRIRSLRGHIYERVSKLSWIKVITFLSVF